MAKDLCLEYPLINAHLLMLLVNLLLHLISLFLAVAALLLFKKLSLCLLYDTFMVVHCQENNELFQFLLGISFFLDGASEAEGAKVSAK